MVSVKVGVCSFTRKMYNMFKIVEVQQTFYNIPQRKTVERWRKEAPQDFEFSFKIFQGLTHPHNSPTWKRYRGKLSEEQKRLVGNLSLNELTQQWVKTMIEFANILKAPLLVVQTPASFKCTSENIEQAREFFRYFSDELEKHGVETLIGWEPRGDWLKEENRSALRKIIDEIPRLIHVVDPFFHEQVIIKETSYFRLHGKPYLNYRYKYSEDDFEFLKQLVKKLEREGVREAYFMFNNTNMINDALRFSSIL